MKCSEWRALAIFLEYMEKDMEISEVRHWPLGETSPPDFEARGKKGRIGIEVTKALPKSETIKEAQARDVKKIVEYLRENAVLSKCRGWYIHIYHVPHMPEDIVKFLEALKKELLYLCEKKF